MTALPSSVPPGPTPPSGLYFGWVIVAASTILTLLTVGMRMGIGPFMLPMSQDLGFSRSLLSSIVAIGMLCYGLGMPAAGWLVARRGTRFVLLAGTAMLVASTLWAVNARTPLQLLLRSSRPAGSAKGRAKNSKAVSNVRRAIRSNAWIC